MFIPGSTQPLKLKNVEGELESFHCTFETVLSFVTGALRPPPCGFNPQPSLSFHCGQQLPRANTCSSTLYLPLPDKLPTFEDFSFKMAFGILNSAGFQRV